MISIGNVIFTENVTIVRMITIAGQGAENTEMNGNASGSVFSIQTDEPVTLKNLKITNGLAEDGGGIHQVNRVLVVENSTVTGNSASFRGGGIFSQSAFGTASTTIIYSNINGNAARNRGGGIVNEGDDATVTIVDSSINDNSASEGGGIFNLGALSIDNSIFSSNSAGQGCGAYNPGVFMSANISLGGNSA
jgi:hypothetical protein